MDIAKIETENNRNYGAILKTGQFSKEIDEKILDLELKKAAIQHILLTK